MALQPALALACHRLPHRQGLGRRLWPPHRRGLFAAQSAAGALRADPVLYRFLGRLHASPRPRRALPRQTQHPENRAQASDLTDAHETLGPQDHLLFKNDPDARRRPWLVCQSLCLWTGSVNMVISTFHTLPHVVLAVSTGDASRMRGLMEAMAQKVIPPCGCGQGEGGED